MKWINKFLIFLMMGAFSFSCKKQELPAKPQPTPFSVMAKSGDAVDPSGGQVQVDVKGQTDGWWVVIPPEATAWCSCSRKYGSGNATISFTFKANTTGASRSVTVQFNPTFDLPPQQLTFSQN